MYPDVPRAPAPPTRYRLVREVKGPHLAELHALYQDWWWTRGRTLEQTVAAVEGSSLVFGVVDARNERLVGFARVLTDGVLKAMVYDVIVHSAHQRQGLGRFLMEALLADPTIQQIRHLDLYCEAAMQPFYQKWGFAAPAGRPLLLMRRAGRDAPQS